MPCRARVPCRAVLCRARVLCRAVPCRAVPCRARAPCHAVPCRGVRSREVARSCVLGAHCSRVRFGRSPTFSHPSIINIIISIIGWARCLLRRIINIISIIISIIIIIIIIIISIMKWREGATYV